MLKFSSCFSFCKVTLDLTPSSFYLCSWISSYKPSTINDNTLISIPQLSTSRLLITLFVSKTCPSSNAVIYTSVPHYAIILHLPSTPPCGPLPRITLILPGVYCVHLLVGLLHFSTVVFPAIFPLLASPPE
ncbi:hypothetical protein ILYODFUR_031009 [Ilyodon furcidens]|uniref:Uncharacterized protein n=1 Tax=Ilyodon furcidens TaxID=33524 RepID=A0ABV0VIM1_9TELE